MKPCDLMQVIALIHCRTLRAGRSIRVIQRADTVLVVAGGVLARYTALAGEVRSNQRGVIRELPGGAIQYQGGGRRVTFRTIAGVLRGDDGSRWCDLGEINYLSYIDGRRIVVQEDGNGLLCQCEQETNKGSRAGAVDHEKINSGKSGTGFGIVGGLLIAVTFVIWKMFTH